MTEQPSKPQRSVHRPITINVESITELPAVRELPHDTEITVNLKMSKQMAIDMISELSRQITMGEFVDFVAVTVTGIS